MILKAGTYRFNNELEMQHAFNPYGNPDELEIPFMSGGETFTTLRRTATNQVREGFLEYLKADGGTELAYRDTVDFVTVGGVREWYGDKQTITVLKDTEVDDTFGTWYIANTEPLEKRLVEIIYRGKTIASLDAGETATLSCEGKKMASDVTVKVNSILQGATAYTVSSVDELPSDAVEGSMAIVSNDDIIGGWLLNERVAIVADIDLYPTFIVRVGSNNMPIKITNMYTAEEDDDIVLYYYDENDNEYAVYNTELDEFATFQYRNIRVIEADSESEAWIRANGKKLPSLYTRENGEWVYKCEIVV